jgi:hypothetical protein
MKRSDPVVPLKTAEAGGCSSCGVSNRVFQASVPPSARPLRSMFLKRRACEAQGCVGDGLATSDIGETTDRKLWRGHYDKTKKLAQEAGRQIEKKVEFRVGNGRRVGSGSAERDVVEGTVHEALWTDSQPVLLKAE